MRLYEFEINYSKYSNALESKNKLYRGVRVYQGDIFEKTPEHRTSRLDNNIYHILLCNLPTWKKYPRRDYSWILTTSFDYAKLFTNKTDNIYRVFPQNNTNIGVCSYDDIWNSFDRTFGHMDDFNTLFSTAFSDIFKKYNISEYDELINGIKILFDRHHDDMEQIIDEYGLTLEIPKTFEDFLKLLTPESNNFELLTKIPSYISRECWTESPCLFIKYDKVDTFLSQI